MSPLHDRATLDVFNIFLLGLGLRLTQLCLCNCLLGWHKNPSADSLFQLLMYAQSSFIKGFSRIIPIVTML